MGNSIVFEIRGGAGRRLARMKLGMEWLQRLKELWRPGQRPRLALALAGGGVIGGMYEVGAITALEEALSGHGGFDIYVGPRAGAEAALARATGGAGPGRFRRDDRDRGAAHDLTVAAA